MSHYILDMLKIMALAAPVYLLLRRPWRCWSRREPVLALFVLFMTALLYLALEGQWDIPSRMLERARQRLELGEQINLIPLYTISTFYRYMSHGDFLVNIIGNLVMFMPWGFGLVLLWRKNRRFWRLLLWALGLTLLIESVQLLIGRHVDVDDLLLNFIGAMAGAGLWVLLQKLFPILRTFCR